MHHHPNPCRVKTSIPFPSKHWPSGISRRSRRTVRCAGRMTVRAFFRFQPDEINTRSDRRVGRDWRMQFLVALVTFQPGMLALKLVTGKVVVEFFLERRNDRIGSAEMLAVTDPAVAFERAVIAGQLDRSEERRVGK